MSISNIAWDAQSDESVYKRMQELGYEGLEIAPTKIWGANPYEDFGEAKTFSQNIFMQYGLRISSIQSIWYGKTEKMFESYEQRRELLDYTKKAILFAEQIGACNLVFGCPKNRCVSAAEDYNLAVVFFKELGEFAVLHNTVIGMEANPTIYGTNFINTTDEAIKLVKDVDSKGFLLNLDFGTMINNGESVQMLQNYAEIINHVHISEPYLKQIEKRDEHIELINWLKQISYNKYVSIEMGQQDLENVFETLEYLKELSV